MLHPDTFESVTTTLEQRKRIVVVGAWCHGLATVLDTFLPDGPDKTYVLRKLREIAMWSVEAITRNPDGSPREPQPGGNEPAEPALRVVPPPPHNEAA